MDPQDLDVPEELRTERLLLRVGRPGDGPALQDAIETSLPDLFPWVPFSGRPCDPETMEAVSRDAQEKFAAGEYFVWRVWEPGGGLLIGTIDLHAIDWSVPCCEIGYWMRSSHAGRGLAAEAVRAVVRCAREALGMMRIEARCDPRNERSWRLVERLGFALEGVARHDDRDAAGDLCSTRVYALTWDEDGAGSPGTP